MVLHKNLAMDIFAFNIKARTPANHLFFHFAFLLLGAFSLPDYSKQLWRARFMLEEPWALKCLPGIKEKSRDNHMKAEG